MLCRGQGYLPITVPLGLMNGVARISRQARMKIGQARGVLVLALMLAICKNVWQEPARWRRRMRRHMRNNSSIRGTPVEATDSSYASSGLAPVSILSTANGVNVYVANSTGSNSAAGNLSAFAVTVAGWADSLTELSSQVSTGVSSSSLAEDSTGSVVLLGNSGGSPDLDVYTFNTANPGMLDPAFAFETGSDPVGALSIAAAP
jgi:hypothetical protein